jgi:HAMP domain-containing protein
MSTEADGARLPLALQIFLACALMVALAISCSAALTRFIGHRIAADAVRQALDKAADAQQRLSRQRLSLLERSTEVIASDPALASYLAASTGDDLGLGGGGATDVASLRDLLAERKEQFGFDLGVLLDAGAAILARSDQAESFVTDLAQDPMVGAALRELGPRSGYWRLQEDLYQAAIMPLTQDGALVGFLLLAQRVDDGFSREIADASGAEIAFWLSEKNQPPRLLTSSLTPERSSALNAGVAGSDAGRAIGDGQEIERLDLRFGQQTWLLRLRPIAGEGATALGAVSALASGEAVLSGYRQLFNLSLLAGLLALLLALILSFWLSRRILAPARRLALAAEAAAAGDYEARVRIAGSDELARLGRAFGSLLSSLREKRDMESYIADVSRHLPDKAAGVVTRTPVATGLATDQRSAAIAEELPIGTRLGERYEILALLGSGGMGMVYKVHDRELGDVAALKLLRSAALRDPDQLLRLKDEIRLARRITHPNVLRTFDFGEADGLAFITMEYVRGVTLRALLIQSGRLPYNAGLRIARQLAAGLEAAHAAGVLHRDIKPENLILEAGGNAKLMDFGIARPTHRLHEGHTQAGMVMGSLDYSSPEQLAGAQVDERSDVYSCGVVLCETLCGGRPYRGSSTVDVYMAQMQNDLTRPSTLWPEIPPALEAIILRCLSSQPELRYPSAAELGRALSGLST